MTLRDLTTDAISEWNVSDGEKSIDLAWWFDPSSGCHRNVRLTFCSGHLVDCRTLPAADRPLPLAAVPPLINPHTHLEFSTLPQPVGPPHPFTEWIESVIRWRMNHPDSAADNVRAGLRESRSAGIGGIGEITTSAAGRDAVLAESDVVSFRELIGFLPDHVDEQVSEIQRHIEQLSAAGPESCTAGISPHAPYSVNPKLLDAAVETCHAQGLPLAIHLAETLSELELLDRGTGEFRSFLESMGLWDDRVLRPGTSILSLLKQLCRVPRVLAVHCNYLTDREIHFLGEHPHIAVVYCPRTHHYFEHAPHPWQKIRSAGGTVVLGTDGRSSNPDLSVWKELLFLAQQFPERNDEELLPMATTLAAEALGVVDRIDGMTLITVPKHAPSERLLSSDSQPTGRLRIQNDSAELEFG